MSALAASTSGSQYLWFLSRGSGIVLLVLLSVVIVLGVATRLGAAPRFLARFAIAELHRTMSLFAVVLLVLHVVTAILDPYVSIGWAATVLPFMSHYRTLAIGLGTLAVDLGAAVLLTRVPGLARRLHPFADRRRGPAHLVGSARRVRVRGHGGYRGYRPPALSPA
jgi:sulfoxide reductase heme-binding subunit YedZ